ncbi:MAG: phosphate signaling complex protein PhoU [Coriobacteriales bacterium]|jgi:phosphate transport system protein|nr:phosphate signaling complex protein PhoU [Coriobacteriales bacterium]
MAREFFDEQLERLDTELLRMGALVERALDGALHVLEDGDGALAARLVEADDAIDQKEREIESLCLDLLLRQQPVARDLRRISAVLKMVTDIERIGDQAADIGGIVLDMGRDRAGGQAWISAPSLQQARHLVALGSAARSQVSAAIDAFVSGDLGQARQVIADDATVNGLFAAARSELFDWMRRSDEEQHDAIDLLLVAKYFERIGDHAQNIAEWVEYSVTGSYKGVPLA